MEIPPDTLKRYTTPTSKARNEREELLEKFLTRLNESREKGGFKALTIPRLAKLVKGRNLYALYNACDKAENFSSLFWWKIKQKP